MNIRTVSDMERNNKTGMYCHLAESLLITVTFIGEFLIGQRTILYALIVAVLCSETKLSFLKRRGSGSL